MKKFKYKTSVGIVLLTIIFVLMIIVFLIFYIPSDIILYKKILGSAFVLLIMYVSLTIFIISIELNDDFIVIKKPYNLFYHYNKINLKDVESIIIRDRGKQQYLNITQKNKDSITINCSGMELNDMREFINELLNMGIKAKFVDINGVP